MANSSALPLLLLGGAALYFISKKKKKDAPSPGVVRYGQRLDADCKGYTTVDPTAWMNYFMEQWMDNDLESKVTTENVEEIIAGIFRGVFPQCEWPPPDGDTFMAGHITWNEMIEAGRSQLSAIGLDASTSSIGSAIGRITSS